MSLRLLLPISASESQPKWTVRRYLGCCYCVCADNNMYSQHACHVALKRNWAPDSHWTAITMSPQIDLCLAKRWLRL
jgi:hypothetical protein